MSIQIRKNKLAIKRKARVRAKIHGTSLRPRLTVFRSNKYTYLQVINDDSGVVIAAANEKMLEKQSKKEMTGTKSEKAKALTEHIASELKKQKVTKLSFDRGSYRYHGKLKIVAQTVREAGIEV